MSSTLPLALAPPVVKPLPFPLIAMSRNLYEPAHWYGLGEIPPGLGEMDNFAPQALPWPVLAVTPMLYHPLHWYNTAAIAPQVSPTPATATAPSTTLTTRETGRKRPAVQRPAAPLVVAKTEISPTPESAPQPSIQRPPSPPIAFGPLNNTSSAKFASAFISSSTLAPAPISASVSTFKSRAAAQDNIVPEASTSGAAGRAALINPFRPTMPVAWETITASPSLPSFARSVSAPPEPSVSADMGVEVEGGAGPSVPVMMQQAPSTAPIASAAIMHPARANLIAGAPPTPEPEAAPPVAAAAVPPLSKKAQGKRRAIEEPEIQASGAKRPRGSESLATPKAKAANGVLVQGIPGTGKKAKKTARKRAEAEAMRLAAEAKYARPLFAVAAAATTTSKEKESVSGVVQKRLVEEKAPVGSESNPISIDSPFKAVPFQHPPWADSVPETPEPAVTFQHPPWPTFILETPAAAPAPDEPFIAAPAPPVAEPAKTAEEIKEQLLRLKLRAKESANARRLAKPAAPVLDGTAQHAAEMTESAPKQPDQPGMLRTLISSIWPRSGERSSGEAEALRADSADVEMADGGSTSSGSVAEFEQFAASFDKDISSRHESPEESAAPVPDTSTAPAAEPVAVLPQPVKRRKKLPAADEASSEEEDDLYVVFDPFRTPAFVMNRPPLAVRSNSNVSSGSVERPRTTKVKTVDAAPKTATAEAAAAVEAVVSAEPIPVPPPNPSPVLADPLPAQAASGPSSTSTSPTLPVPAPVSNGIQPNQEKTATVNIPTGPRNINARPIPPLVKATLPSKPLAQGKIPTRDKLSAQSKKQGGIGVQLKLPAAALSSLPPRPTIANVFASPDASASHHSQMATRASADSGPAQSRDRGSPPRSFRIASGLRDQIASNGTKQARSTFQRSPPPHVDPRPLALPRSVSPPIPTIDRYRTSITPPPDRYNNRAVREPKSPSMSPPRSERRPVNKGSVKPLLERMASPALNQEIDVSLDVSVPAVAPTRSLAERLGSTGHADLGVEAGSAAPVVAKVPLSSRIKPAFLGRLK